MAGRTRAAEAASSEPVGVAPAALLRPDRLLRRVPAARLSIAVVAVALIATEMRGLVRCRAASVAVLFDGEVVRDSAAATAVVELPVAAGLTVFAQAFARRSDEVVATSHGLRIRM